MNIQLNGKPHVLAQHAEEDVTLGHLLAKLDLPGRRFAVEVNGDLVPRAQHASYRLAPGDRVEVVQAIGGG